MLAHYQGTDGTWCISDSAYIGDEMTHKYIKSKFVRTAYAQELWQARKALRYNPMKSAILFGMESAFWKIERVLR
jgi:hypothetical protein